MDDMVAKALHAARQHFDEGGFLDSLRNYFTSGPEVLSTGEKLVDDGRVNWGNPESAADFFRADKADKALRLAREAQAKEPEAAPPRQVQERAPVEAPRQQISSPPPAPAFRPVRTLPGDTVEPHAYPQIATPDLAFGEPVYGERTQRLGGDENQNIPSAVQMDYTLRHGRTMWPSVGNFATYAGIAPENFNSHLGNSISIEEARQSMPERRPEFIAPPPAPQAEVARAVALAQETIPDFNTALANVEKLHNAGIYSGEALDKAGEMLGAHLRARDAGIPVEEALRLTRAEGPRMVNQGMPTPTRASQALAYSPEAPKNPARAAIDQATDKMGARAPQGPELNDHQRDLIIRTIAAETSGKTPEESQAIAHVILNRIQSGKYGATPEAVLFARKQFEPWSNPNGANYPMRFTPESRRYGIGQTALDAALGAEDITNGATNFWAPKAQAALGRRPPKWGRTGGVDIGETRFHNLSRADGGLVDDALHVVREHHADGEAVGMNQRMRETIASIDPERSQDQPVMDPEKMGEAWNRARQNYQNFPVQEGEPTASQFTPSVRQEIGAAIAGEGGGRNYGSELRNRAAKFAVGSSGLDTGMGALDFVPGTSQALGVTDIAHDIGQGNYGEAAAGAALPVAMTAAQRFAGPLGAAGRRAVEIAKDYAKPAAATAAGVAANVVTPEDAEAAKLPKLFGTFKHPVSGTKLVTPIEEMRPVFSAPTEAITPRRPMDWASTEGGVYMPATWDRSRGDRAILEEINGQKLTNPQRMEGGPLYMNWGDVQPEKQVAASGQSIVDRMIETSAEAKKLAGDKDVYLANVLMGLEGADFSHMVANPLVDLARQRGFSKSEAALVDDAIRKSIIQNLPSKAPMDKKIAYASAWPGIMNPDLDQLMWKMGGGYRSAIAKAMDTAAMKTLGVPDVASIRHAATQPELLNSPNLSTGFSVAKVDPGAPSVSSGHTTYPIGMKGLGYEGGSQVDIPFNLFWRDFMKTRPPGESMAHTQRAFTMQMPVQRADPQWVDTISNFERNALRGAIPLE